jgi:hypothetical protein
LPDEPTSLDPCDDSTNANALQVPYGVKASRGAHGPGPQLRLGIPTR